MIYIIQTNTLIDNEGVPRDFQSMVFAYSSWDDYKNALLHEESTGKIIFGTMYGCIKPRNAKIENVLINDDKHLECFINNGVVNINVKAYKVDSDNLKNIVTVYK